MKIRIKTNVDPHFNQPMRLQIKVQRWKTMKFLYESDLRGLKRSMMNELTDTNLVLIVCMKIDSQK